MIEGTSIDFRHEYLSRADRAGTVLKELVPDGSEYTYDRNYESSGHQWGIGGSSIVTYTVRDSHAEATLVMKIYKTYATTSDDFFDNAQSAQVELQLIREDARTLFDHLWQRVQDLALGYVNFLNKALCTRTPSI